MIYSLAHKDFFLYLFFNETLNRIKNVLSKKDVGNFLCSHEMSRAKNLI